MTEMASKWVTTTEEEENGVFTDASTWHNLLRPGGVGMRSPYVVPYFKEPPFEDQKADLERPCAQASGGQPAMPQ